MNDSDIEIRTMTVAEIGTMRKIIAWRKASGIVFAPMNSRMLGHWAEWHQPERNGRSVTVDRSVPGRVGVQTERRWGSFTWIDAATFTQAVDLLVALDYLPTQFSTAYLDGWDASIAHRVFHSPDGGINPPRNAYPAVSR